MLLTKPHAQLRKLTQQVRPLLPPQLTNPTQQHQPRKEAWKPQQRDNCDSLVSQKKRLHKYIIKTLISGMCSLADSDPPSKRPGKGGMAD
ncbi:hypothetical protein Hanom_Chr17g01552371 [Helianthus anomalus]